MDPETAALIIQLLIEEASDMFDASAGKGKGWEGELSDTQVALLLHKEDLERSRRRSILRAGSRSMQPRILPRVSPRALQSFLDRRLTLSTTMLSSANHHRRGCEHFLNWLAPFKISSKEDRVRYTKSNILLQSCLLDFYSH
jgi:hypothetical protein